MKEPHTAVGDANKRRGGSEPQSKRALIAARARLNPTEKFSSLAHHLDVDLIKEHLQKIPLKSATGVDGMTVEQARTNADWLLRPIMNQIHKGQYDAPPVRRVYIPKSDGRQRPIGVPQVLDRSIQGATATILNEIYEQDFLNCSFGFRPKLGCHNAVATISELMYRHNMNFALEVDIRDFFGSLDHKWMRKFLEHRISDERILKLIESWLKAGVMEDGKMLMTEVGTPQGGSISPLLANIYLHYVLDLWFEKKIKNQLQGKAHLVRYCDDFVIMFQNRTDLSTVKPLLEARIGQFGLEVATEKTHTTDVRYRSKVSSADRRRITFLGFDIYRSGCLSGKGSKPTFKTEAKRFSRAKQRMKEKVSRNMHKPIKHQAQSINAILRGHYNYYGVAGNSRRLNSFHYETTKFWRKCLSKRSQRGKVNWEKMDGILTVHPLVPPKLKVKYSELSKYVRL